jgi:hypothetical protein
LSRAPFQYNTSASTLLLMPCKTVLRSCCKTPVSGVSADPRCLLHAWSGMEDRPTSSIMMDAWSGMDDLAGTSRDRVMHAQQEDTRCQKITNGGPPYCAAQGRCIGKCNSQVPHDTRESWTCPEMLHIQTHHYNKTVAACGSYHYLARAAPCYQNHMVIHT